MELGCLLAVGRMIGCPGPDDARAVISRKNRRAVISTLSHINVRCPMATAKCLVIQLVTRMNGLTRFPTVPIYYLAKPQPRERAWQNQRGKKTLMSLTLV
ncbi:MAG: hypothetical protein DI617_08580 [Streptococcus pyogenes]|nr:MAG: hypothetical protein DI617_08580 [Streptococcus pyogenes]